MPINNGGKWLMLSRSGEVVEGESHPEAASVLAAPGASVPQDVVDKYDLAGRMEGEAPHPTDSAGRPVVHTDDGRAMALDVLAKDHPARAKFEKAQEKPKALTDKPKDAPKPEPAKPEAPK